MVLCLEWPSAQESEFSKAASVAMYWTACWPMAVMNLTKKGCHVVAFNGKPGKWLMLRAI